MMSSTWKISVFGIVALMLSFGLAAGDAFAHSDGHSDHPRTNVRHFTDSSITVHVTSLSGDEGTGGAHDRDNRNLFDDGTPKLRATEKLDSLVFTYSHGGKSAKGTVTLTIPRTWTRAVRDNRDGVDEEGEIEVDGAQSYSVTSGGGGWQVKANMTADPPYGGPTTITYKKVTVPNRAGKYEFGISSTTVGDGHSSTVNPHSTVHATEWTGTDDPPADYSSPHSADDRNLGTITIAVDSAKDNHANHEHETGGTGALMTLGNHRHPTDKSHHHNTDDGTVDAFSGEHSHPYNAGVAAHKHTTAGGPAVSVIGGDVEHGATHTEDGSNAYKATHAHAEDGTIATFTHAAVHGGANILDGGTHKHDVGDKTVANINLGHSHAVDQDGNTGDHEHDSNDDAVARLTTAHVHTGADAATTHTHGSGGTVAFATHDHANQDGDTLNHEHATGDNTVARGTSHVHTGAEADATHSHDGNGTVAFAAHDHTDQDGDTLDHEHEGNVQVNDGNYSGASHVHTGVGAETSHSHDGDGTVRNVLRSRYFDSTSADFVIGHRHDRDLAGDTRTHQHGTDNSDGVTVSIVPDHPSNHDPQVLGQPGGVDVHTHQGGLVTGVLDGDTVADHTHSGGDVVMVTPHTHTGTNIDVTIIAHKHGSDGLLKLVTAHTQDTDADPIGAVNITVTAHEHNADGTFQAVTAHTDDDTDVDITVFAHKHGSDGAVTPITGHTHPSEGVVVVSETVIAHTHADATDTAVADALEHLHGDVPLHTHEEDGRTVKAIVLHTHAGNGVVDVVEPHDHGGGPPAGGIDQTVAHLHAVEHNGKYALYVGPVANGIGTVTISNTGTPRLAKHGADPYKGLYLATKGQALGNVRLTFEAKGTMVKGAGIMIQLPENNLFPQMHRSGSSGPAGGVSVADSRSRTFADFAATGDDPYGITADSVFLKTKIGLEAGNRISVNIRGVTLKVHGDTTDADKDSTAEVVISDFVVSASSPLATPTPDDLMGGELKELGDPPKLRITSVHGSGKMALESTALAAPLSRAGKGEDLGNLIFTFTADGGGMATGSKVEITIPSEFPNPPFEPASDSDERPGAVTLIGDADTDFLVNGQVLTGTLKGELSNGGTITFTYKGAKAPANEGEYTFKVRASSGPHSAPKDLGDDHQKKVEVTGAHGSGTISLTRGGSNFRMAAKDAQLGNLKFTYTAAGRMANGAEVQITVPDGWSSPHHDNGDGINTAGEVKLTGSATLEITGRPWKLTATTNAALVAGNKLVFDYKSVKAPAAAGSYTFETSAIAFKGALTIDDPGARLDSSPSVGIDQAPDGSGTLSVSKSTAPALTMDATGAYLVKAGESLGNLTFTYTATGKMEIGSSVEVTIPGTDDDWPTPTNDNGDGITEAGESVVAGAGQAGLSISGRTLIATITVELQSGNTFTIKYNNINAPTIVGEHDFTTQSKSTPGGTLTNLTAGSPTIKVGVVPVGVVSISTTDADGMSTPLTAAGPGMALGNVTITYTATARITAGAKVMVTVPVGWTTPNIDNNDGVDGAGEVSLTGSGSLEVTGGGGQPWMLVATTSAVLASGDTLVFTYKNVTAPSTEGSYTFTTVASISAASTPVPIAAQPTPIIVRSVVTAIAIEADDSFFAGESLSGMVTLWAGTGAANALGDMVVTLSSDSETGSFTADSITIADNTNGAAFTYNDTAPGMVTLTATSGTLTATAAVTVKTGVAGLSVTPDLVKAGSDVTVTATGKAGGGTVKVMDAEAMQVGSTKSLDPVVEPEEGDVTYSRTITLPADLADGTYTVTVDIQGLSGQQWTSKS